MPSAKRKPASEWTVLGKPMPRPDLPAAGHRRNSNSSTTCACRACCTAAWCGRPPWAPRWSAWMKSSVKGMPGLVKVVVKKNFVGVVAEKPWQAMQAAAKLKVTWTPGTGLPNQADFYDHLRKQTYPRHAAGRFQRRGAEARGSGHGAEGHLSSSVSDARIDGQFLRRRRRAGRQGHDLVGHAGGLVSAEHGGHGARAEAGKRARDLPPRLRLLRPERRRHRHLRCGAALAGRGQTGARAAHAQGRDGVGELRQRVRDR